MGHIICCITVDVVRRAARIEHATRTVNRQRTVMEVQDPRFTVVKGSGGQVSAIEVKCSRGPQLGGAQDGNQAAICKI